MLVDLWKAFEQPWNLDSAPSEGSSRHRPWVFRLSGLLDWRALRLALEALEHRHEVLRTSLTVERGHVTPCVHRPGVFVLPTLSLLDGTRDSVAREARLAEALRHEARRPFDLRGAALIRAALFVLDAREHALRLEFHPILIDVRSQGVLLRELSDLYAAYQRGGPAPALPPVESSARPSANDVGRGPLADDLPAPTRRGPRGVPLATEDVLAALGMADAAHRARTLEDLEQVL
ncbi:condensation domain-containing protein [Myxococcus sp. K38C18041901]|uniref:condensation domain-containing protein n=1 Tax=Myxococcus guangdongensis TaxID=2906760 RepID=UPI0020A7E4F3|nr:condensation domain-containing protein [Myxococcus guangdongensis]MCP3057293.1 condensation domain-containing protein [Myxococcus guangdongensis]